jgi:ParB-like chromosome segregation protein Spo0J
MHCLSEIVEEVDGAAEMYENISCTVYEGDLDGAIVVNLLENVERDDLNPADAADGVVALMERIGNQERVGARMGKSQGWVSKYLILGTCLCARGKDALRAGAISLKQAKSLTDFIKRDKTPDEEKQHQLLDRWLTGNKEGDESTAPASKRERTMRTRADVEALRARLTKLEDNDCDPLHKASLQTFAAWFFCEIEEGDVLIRQAPEEPRVLASEPEEAPATKKRVREEKHVEKEEPKQPKLLPKKKEK